MDYGSVRRLTSSLLVFVISVDKLNVPMCLFKLVAHSSRTEEKEPGCPTREQTEDRRKGPRLSNQGAD